MSLLIENGRKLTVNYTDTHREIIEQSKQGKIKAQYKLYQLYAKAMYNICFRMLNNQYEAEDMLQESFSEAFLQLDNFRYESSFGAWLKKIVINKCINSLKRKKVDLVFYDELPVETTNESEPDFDDIQMTIKNVHKAIEQLADGYRIILTLYLLEGYDHSEIAQILNISESTSKSQYLRAKRKIKEIITTGKSIIDH